jgi:biotin transport system ATP-binding protein/energy-coupling factor transport system ATP-binding protein
VIKAENLFFRYTEKSAPVLKGINLTIEKGEYVAIIGPNGCGKSTLLRHFNALLLPSAGDVWVDEKNTRDLFAHREIRQKVGMIFQNPENQIVGVTVEEDAAFGPGNLRLPPAEIRARVEAALAATNLLQHAGRAPHTLSGGEKQLLAIAGVLAMNPGYIVLDEPASSLDPAARKTLAGIIKELLALGIGVIHVTHHLDEIVPARRVLVMNEGEILLDAPPAEVFSRVEWLQALGLGVPQVTELMWRLAQLGLPVRTDVLTVEEACREISRLGK